MSNNDNLGRIPPSVPIIGAPTILDVRLVTLVQCGCSDHPAMLLDGLGHGRPCRACGEILVVGSVKGAAGQALQVTVGHFEAAPAGVTSTPS